MGLEMEKMRTRRDGVCRDAEYYYSHAHKVYTFGKRYPDYRIQIGPDIAEYIVERKANNPDYMAQSIIDRFEIMEDGFKVECYEAQIDRAQEEARKSGKVLNLGGHIVRYMIERHKKEQKG